MVLNEHMIATLYLHKPQTCSVGIKAQGGWAASVLTRRSRSYFLVPLMVGLLGCFLTSDHRGVRTGVQNHFSNSGNVGVKIHLFNYFFSSQMGGSKITFLTPFLTPKWGGSKIIFLTLTDRLFFANVSAFWLKNDF